MRLPDVGAIGRENSVTMRLCARGRVHYLGRKWVDKKDLQMSDWPKGTQRIFLSFAGSNFGGDVALSVTAEIKRSLSIKPTIQYLGEW
ncbi:hypothetical protein PSE10C_50060 [Pseudomonas amygdali pv. eriobotryae]|uniref:Uncharacterized protein n=1 Tax=Pseudomonas amygdali pv. eriobotryae TaxID=129137 RepID=A0A9P3AC81_PSEA0|nr:hypothetical protein AL052_26470 [Pseudomonas amygdali pv. eriobotryae]GFZ59215.1 hypothetical protein PSE10A_17260 [Pseudomonas amygdali pv. eriobotryae]GFZ74264.1 hypothetical protein PSE10C_50060 [Pseudomonas amygdali pv. eriobotryae]